MRTSIFLSGIMITGALDHIAKSNGFEIAKWPEQVYATLAFFLIAFFIMDIVDVFTRKK